MSAPVVLVVGGSGDLGRHLSVHLAQHGATVVATYRTGRESVEELSRRAEDLPGAIEPAEVDVTRSESIVGAVDAAVQRHGRLDAMVFMSGITRDNWIGFLSEEEWDSVHTVNLKGAFLACKAVSRPMMVQREGRIVLVSSLSGILGVPGQTNYAAAKAGLHGLARALSRELGRFNVVVNVVAPGLVESAVNDQIHPGQRDSLLAGSSLQRVGRQEEISSMIRYLAIDPGATYMTGQVIAVDGGIT